MRKSAFCICENKGTDQVTTQLISAFVFNTKILLSISGVGGGGVTSYISEYGDVRAL